MPTKEKEIVIAKPAQQIISKMESYEIESPKDMTAATEMLSILNKELKALTIDKEKITKPLNESLKEIRGRYKPKETMLESAITKIRMAMSKYQTAEKKRADEEARKLAERVGPGKGKLTVETAVRKMDEIDRPAEAVTTDAGMVKFRTVQKLKITSMEKLRDYIFKENLYDFVALDEKAVLQHLKEGYKMPGCEIEDEQIPVNFR